MKEETGGTRIMTLLSEVKGHYGRVKNYVNGQWGDSESQEVLDITNPTTGKVIGQVPLSTPAEVQEAIHAAKQAFAGWRETPSMRRGQHMYRLKELMEKNTQDL